jgi:hypothetical protein
MDILRESYLNEYRRREQLANLARKQQIHEALTGSQRNSHILAQMGHILHALGNARKIRIEIHFDYNDPQPEATGRC